MDRRYCVYVHKTEDGIVFYIGSGTLARAFTKELSVTKGVGTCRGKKYSSFVEKLGFNYKVEVLEDNLTKSEAVALEADLITKYKGVGAYLTNTNSPVVNVKINLQLMQEYFVIDNESYTGLSWRKDYFSRSGKKYMAGNPAGTVSKEKDYYRVGLFGETYSVHRIIMVLSGHSVDGFVVDHLDGNHHNNSVENLRVVTQKQNLQNKSIRKDNTSGFTGINWKPEKEYFIVNWYENGKRLSRTFPIRKYEFSYDLALNAAVKFRKEKV